MDEEVAFGPGGAVPFTSQQVQPEILKVEQIESAGQIQVEPIEEEEYTLPGVCVKIQIQESDQETGAKAKKDQKTCGQRKLPNNFFTGCDICSSDGDGAQYC